jgi:hypothetical protein
VDARPDGERVLTKEMRTPREGEHYDTLTEWDLSAGRAVRSFRHPDKARWLDRAGYLPDGLHAWTQYGGTQVTFWDLAQGKPVREMELDPHDWRPAFGPGGLMATTAYAERTVLRDGATGRAVDLGLGRALPPGQLCFFPDGQRLLVYGGSPHSMRWERDENRMLLVWDAREGRQLTLKYPRGPHGGPRPPAPQRKPGEE